MEAKDFALFVADALADKKAVDITILEVEGLVGYTSYFVVCTFISAPGTWHSAPHDARGTVHEARSGLVTAGMRAPGQFRMKHVAGPPELAHAWL